MAASSRQCPKCNKPIQVYATDTLRLVTCPHCKTLLQIGTGGIEVAKPTKPRPRNHTVPPEPPTLPPSVVSPSQGTIIIVAAFAVLGVVVVGGATATGLKMLRSADEPTGTHAMANTPGRPPSATDLRRTDEQQDRDKGAQIVERKARGITPEHGTTTGNDKPYGPTRTPMPSPAPASGPRLPSSLVETVETVRRSVATIDADGLGSGFVVQRRRWLVTNFHVVAGVNQARAVRKKDNGEDWIDIDVEGFVACDPRKDLVILVLAKDWPAEPLLLSGEKPRLGEDVFAVGTPSGLMETVSRGIVSQIRTAADIDHDSLAPSTKIIQTDAFIAQGSSGGPLCSAAGKVIGINSFAVKTSDDDAEIHFAVAAEELADLIQKARGPTRPLNELPPLRR